MEPWAGEWLEFAGRDSRGEGSDASLARRAKHDPAEFEPLYLRYRDSVLAYCYRKLGDRDEAEEAASTAVVAALRGLATYQEHGNSFRSWLFTIVHNEIALRLRTRIRHPEEPIEAAAAIIDLSRTPEELAILADDQLRLAALLSVLSTRERNVIELRLANLSTAEIARVLEISPQNVRTTQCRAIARLRTVFATAGMLTEGEIDV